MKRSEVLKEIAYDIINADADLRAGIGNPNNEYMTKEWADALAEHVLNGLEQANIINTTLEEDI